MYPAVRYPGCLAWFVSRVWWVATHGVWGEQSDGRENRQLWGRLAGNNTGPKGSTRGGADEPVQVSSVVVDTGYGGWSGGYSTAILRFPLSQPAPIAPTSASSESASTHKLHRVLDLVG